MKRKRILVHKITINELERHRQFEIKLPANVTRITGVVITTQNQ